jgi:thymidine kinase
MLRVLATIDSNVDVVAVDEAFMIEGIADALIDVFRLGKTVIVSSIDLSSSCKPFPEMTKMFPWATNIQKCPAVCTVCNNDAYYTIRKTESEDEISVGGSEMYEPRCWFHHDHMNESA